MNDDSLVPPRPRNAIITMAIGRLPYAERTLPLMRQWAERQGWDFIVLSQRRLKVNPNWPARRFGIHIEKFQLYELLARFDRVLYLDADIIVNPAIPNPFALVPPDMVGGVWDDVGPGAWKREEELLKLERKHGPLPPLGSSHHRFLNAGVLVLSRTHRELWRFDRSAFVRGRWPEQSLFNYRLQASGTAVYGLPETFNLMPLHAKRWNDEALRRNAYLIHYASRPAKSNLAEDLPVFERAWEYVGRQRREHSPAWV